MTETMQRGRRRLSPVGVIGEVLVTAGLLVLLFVGWQVWWNTWVHQAQQTAAAAQLGKQWLEQSGSAGGGAKAGSGALPPDRAGAIPVADEPAAVAQTVGILYVPRFGQGWKRTIRQSVDEDAVLNSYDAGVGHYPGTAMPGGVGNFAVAAHDTGYGNAFLHLQNLELGDRVYVQTKQGFYTYVFRDYEYVPSDAVSVLLPVPQDAKAQASDRIITLTTCNPPYHAVERLIAYGVLESFSTTPPAAIAGEIG